jgi:hypothetical protein
LRKVRKLSFLGILCVFVVIVFLAGISLMQAQVQIQKKPVKPPPPPEDTWAVRIPTSDSGLMFYGIGDGYYEDNDANIQISVEKSGLSTWKKYYDFVYAFKFTLTNENVGTEPDYSVGFQNVPEFSEVTYPDEGKPCCQFPGDYSCEGGGCLNCLPDCMGAFLNSTHPHPDYESFYIYVDIFDQDIELMVPGQQYVFGSTSDQIGIDKYEPGDYLFMVARYRNKCEPDPAYHDVEIKRNINYWRALDLGNPHNIVIERLATYDMECDGVWRIWVLPYDFSGRDLEGFLKVQERYCTRDKRPTWYYSMEAKGRFDFYIDFIKNPTTQ